MLSKPNLVRKMVPIIAISLFLHQTFPIAAQSCSLSSALAHQNFFVAFPILGLPRQQLLGANYEKRTCKNEREW